VHDVGEGPDVRRRYGPGAGCENDRARHSAASHSHERRHPRALRWPPVRARRSRQGRRRRDRVLRSSRVR
jgi:hypothetical protein